MANGVEGVDQAPEAPVDGRRARWDEHRVQRRRDLVEASLRAIRRHGAGVGMDEIAAQAGTSKTVIYRHFGDRAGLWSAVVDSVHDYLLSNLEVPLSLNRLEPTALVTGLADAYLAVVERDLEIYRFVVNRPSGEASVNDPVASFTSRIGALLGSLLHTRLGAAGLDPAMADSWGHGIAGCIWAVADAWLASGMERDRAAIVGDIAALVTPTLNAISPDAFSRSQR